jgi:uncharacterized protein (TIGR02186 family)
MRSCLISGRKLLRVVATAAAFAPAASIAQPVIMDLSEHTVAITANFDGSDILLFGSTQGESDVIAIVRGPQSNRIVRRKERKMGIWVNGDAVQFDEVPSFYAVAATRPPAELLPEGMLQSYAIGAGYLALTASLQKNGQQENSARTAIDAATQTTYRTALVRNMQRLNLYNEDVFPIKVLGNSLFRVSLHFPTNVPVGSYDVQILLVRDGQVVSTGKTHMQVGKSGIEAGIYDFAHRYPPAYGLVAILIAVLAGWLASAVFRKA